MTTVDQELFWWSLWVIAWIVWIALILETIEMRREQKLIDKEK